MGMDMALLDCVIDVSHHNDGIDWPKVANDGIVLSMVKSSEGAGFLDPRWTDNQGGAISVGIAVIPYHFVNADDPSAQANRVLTFCQPGQAYMLDWEGRAAGTEPPTGMDAIGALLTVQLGRPPLLYDGIKGSTPYTPSALMLTWPRIIPRYHLLSTGHQATQFADLSPAQQAEGPGEAFLFWQYTSTGIIDGISGPCDRSIGNFDSVDVMIAWARGT